MNNHIFHGKTMHGNLKLNLPSAPHSTFLSQTENYPGCIPCWHYYTLAQLTNSYAIRDSEHSRYSMLLELILSACNVHIFTNVCVCVCDANFTRVKASIAKTISTISTIRSMGTPDINTKYFLDVLLSLFTRMRRTFMHVQPFTGNCSKS